MFSRMSCNSRNKCTKEWRMERKIFVAFRKLIGNSQVKHSKNAFTLFCWACSSIQLMNKMMILNGAAWIRYGSQRFPKGINRWDEKNTKLIDGTNKIDQWNEEKRSNQWNGDPLQKKIWNQIVNRATKW